MVPEIAETGAQAKEALNAMLLQLVQSIEAGVDIAKVEIPIVLQQLILRDQIVQSMYLIIIIGMVAVTTLAIRKGLKTGFWNNADPTPAWCFSMLFGISTMIAMPIYFFGGAFTKLVTVFAAPKLYIIEYLVDKIN